MAQVPRGAGHAAVVVGFVYLKTDRVSLPAAPVERAREAARLDELVAHMKREQAKADLTVIAAADVGVPLRILVFGTETMLNPRIKKQQYPSRW